MPEISIIIPSEKDYYDLSLMVGELLSEIMQKIDAPIFNYNQVETEKRAKSLLEKGKYWVFLAKDKTSGRNIALARFMKVMLFIQKVNMEQSQNYMFAQNIALNQLVYCYLIKQVSLLLVKIGGGLKLQHLYCQNLKEH